MKVVCDSPVGSAKLSRKIKAQKVVRAFSGIEKGLTEKDLLAEKNSPQTRKLSMISYQEETTVSPIRRLESGDV